MSANITLTNYVPKFQISAKDRAANRWAGNQLTESQARNQRLSRFFRQSASTPVAVQPFMESNMSRGDHTYWHRKAAELRQAKRQRECRMCKGTGEIWVYIDFPPDPCPGCQYLDESIDERGA